VSYIRRLSQVHCEAGGYDVFFAKYDPIGNPGSEHDQDFILDQIYPNPASKTTTIGFTLLDKEKITLKISNLFGKEMKLIMDEVKNPGRYLVEIDVRDLETGIYFNSITSDDEIITREMVVVK